MDRVFSVEGISDQFWSSPPRAVLTAAEESSKLNRSTSEWSFRRFLQEASVSDSSASPPRPPAGDRLHGVDANEFRENARQISQEQSNSNDRDCNRNGEVNKDKKTKSTTKKSTGAESVNLGPPRIPADSGDYQAFLKSKLTLACAAVALCRVRFYFL